MKRLLLLRHAKSSRDDPTLDDHERPLNKRGEQSAGAIGDWLRERKITPQVVLCSTARRTRQTLDRLMPFAGPTPKVELLPGLYLAGAPAILQRLRKLDDDVGSVMAIGHNPGFEQLAASLAGEGKPDVIAQLAAKYPTGALADFHFSVKKWSQISPGGGRLATFIRPRDLD